MSEITPFKNEDNRGFRKDRHTFTAEGISGHLDYSYMHIEDDTNLDDLCIKYALKDAFSLTKDFLYIDLLVIDGEHNKGQGSILLQEFLKSHKEELIILNAGAIDEDTYKNHLDEHLEKLTHFYNKNGFININNYIGFCEETIVFGYDNSKLHDIIIDPIIKLRKEAGLSCSES